MGKVFNNIKNFNYTISHPIVIWHWFVGFSYWICLFAIIAGVMMYILGYKKGSRVIATSLVLYTIIQAINCI